MLRHVDLCSGIGGFSLGFEWAELSKPVLFCDIEPWSRQILAKHWPDVPIAEDVKELANDSDRNVPNCDIITAGYPCQPFSQAGKRRGTEDDRHIWPFIFSIIQSKRPTWCVFENVYGHVTLGLDEVLSDLERESYATRPFVVPACATDAPHRRDRLWIIARNVGNSSGRRYGDTQEEVFSGRHGSINASIARTTNVANAQSKCRNERFNAKRKQTSQQKGLQTQIGTSSSDVADTSSARLQGCEQLRENEKQTGTRRKGADGSASECSDDARGKANFWQPEPSVGRVAHGIPRRVDRLRGLGNAIVPQIAMRIGQTIKATYDASG